MLSVLIPTYNYNTLPLVKEVHKQCSKEKIAFEIIVIDDASANVIEENNEINKLSQASYRILDKNIGRSSIRNLLAERANFKHLLFLDADVLPASDDFIKNYVDKKLENFDLIIGGICYKADKPSNNQLLRWHYGNKRETISAEKRKKNPFNNFASANFYIKKDVFFEIKFNEVLRNYGHEDTLFIFDFKIKNKNIAHINNPVFHLGLETNEEFLQKSLLTVENTFRLKQHQLIDNTHIKILAFHNKFNNIKIINNCIYFLGSRFEPFIIKNLLGSSPSLKLLDFYKLYYLIKLERNA